MEEEIAELRKLDAVIRPIEAARDSVIHFHKLNHEQRIAVSAALGQSQFAFLTINADKPRIESPQLKTGYALYFYMTRYLLERLSWLARDAPLPSNGRREIKIIFSNRSRMSYDDLRSYVTRLRGMQTSIYWPAIDEALITTRTHKELIGLRAVDAVASGIRWGLELSPYGFCEDRYLRLMAPRVYRRNGRYRSYGMKFFPEVPAIEPERDNRYGWIDAIFPK